MLVLSWVLCAGEENIVHTAVRSALAALSALVVTVAPAVASGPSSEDAPVVVDRLAGTDRYETAALISAQFPAGVDTVYLANGENWAQGADAVVAGAAAGSGTLPPTVPGPSGEAAPILLVRATGIPAATRAALEELEPTTAVILGGPLVVSPAVEEQLLAAGINPVRVQGKNRYGTAALLATTFDTGLDTVYVASGQPMIPKPPYVPMMPDALTASARAGAEGAPVLLTRSDNLPVETRDALLALNPASITIVGGHGTVSAWVEHQLSQIAPVTRIGGATRYETAANLFASYATDGARTYLTSGEWFADSLAVSALAASEGAPLLLAAKVRVPVATREALVALDPAAVRFIGGPLMLEPFLEDVVRDLLTPGG